MHNCIGGVVVGGDFTKKRTVNCSIYCYVSCSVSIIFYSVPPPLNERRKLYLKKCEMYQKAEKSYFLYYNVKEITNNLN